MTRRQRTSSPHPLRQQLDWFIRLRWIAGVAVLCGAAVEWGWLGWYGYSWQMAAVGGGILVYNAGLWGVMRRVAARPIRTWWLAALAWGQLLLDFGCLTLLVLWTGGIASGLMGFFVFHMVFASLLLPRRLAFAGAAAAILMLAEGLWLSGRWPAGRVESVTFVGWMMTLLLTVWLTNRITRSLRRQRRRLLVQNRRIRGMSGKLRRQQQGMIQQEKMAAVGRMAAGIAHEVANPLASMDGLLQLMERRPEKLRPEAVATLRQQVARINQTVRRMTEFAHPGEGEWQIVSLNEVVEQALEVIHFDARLKRVHVERELAPEPPRVRILTHSMQQVVLNLVINALDAMENTEEPKLTLRTSESGGMARLEIADNGHGIDAVSRRRLFEPFFTTKPPGKGTGLGLWISYRLAQGQGGQISLESRDGAGACFAVTLPAVRVDAAPSSNAPQAVQPAN